jgi:hypothetical protein
LRQRGLLLSIFGLVLFAVGVSAAPSADAIPLRGRVGSSPAGEVETVRLVLSGATRVIDLGDTRPAAGVWRYRLDGAQPIGRYELEAVGVSRLDRVVTRASVPFVIGVARDQLVIRIDIVRANGPGAIRVEGWAIDRDSVGGTGVAEIELFLDDPPPTGRRLAVPHIGNERSDVAHAFMNEQFRASGWWIDLDTGTLSHGSHRVFALATSSVTGQTATADAVIDVVDGTQPAASPEPSAGIVIDEPAPYAVTFGSPSIKPAAIGSTLFALAGFFLIVRIGRRSFVLPALLVIGTLAAAVAFAFVDPTSIRSDAAAAIASKLPHLDRRATLEIAQTHGAIGTLPAPSIAFAVLPLAVTAVALARDQWARRTAPVWLAITAVIVVLMVASGSRGVIVALASGILVIVLVRERRLSVAASIVVFACIAAIAAALAIEGTYVSPGRGELWRQGLGLLGREFWPGIGRFAQLSLGAHQPHNTPLDLLIEFGPLGLAGLCVFFGSSIGAAVSLLRRSTSTQDDRLRATIALGVLGALLVAGMTESIVAMALPIKDVVLTLVIPTPFLFAALPFARS